MNNRRPTVLLPQRPVRWLGVILVATGLVLPGAVLVWRARAWQTPRQEEGTELRPEMVILLAGRFLMGSTRDEPDRDDDETLHEVVLTRTFALSRTEVTQGQFAAVMGERSIESRKYFADRSCWGRGLGDDLPVVCIDWFEAVRYCNELSSLEDLPLAYEIDREEIIWHGESPGYRLPTEAEWEYAARAGTRTVYVGTDSPEAACRFANVRDEVYRDKYAVASSAMARFFPCSDRFAELAPVRLLGVEPNLWQLRGLGGNVSEWVWDWYDLYNEEGAQPIGAPGGVNRVFRGGSWRDSPRSARVARRSGAEPDSRFSHVGFRVARSLPSSD